MIRIGGLQKVTLIDYPGKLAATVFCLGCNFKCPFCYSSELVLPEKIKKQPKISEKELFKFLKERKELIDAVCLSMAGDEPVVIRNNKILKHLPIEKLWDNAKQINYRINPIPYEYQKINFECLTKDGFREAKEIIRHKTKELYKIIVSPGNYNVKLTGGHSIFVLTKKGLEVKEVKEIKRGDFLLSANSGLIPDSSHGIKAIDLIDYLPETLNSRKDWIITKTYLRNKFSNVKIKIPRRIPVTKQLCEFLGYAVAEGSASYRYLKGKKRNSSAYTFALGNELKLAKKILRLYRNVFGSNRGTVYKKIAPSGKTLYNVLVGNILIARFVNKLVGKGFIRKHIPVIIFNTTSKNKIAFLKALAEGDGHQRIRQEKTQQEFSVKTASLRLAADIIFLVNTLGAFSWVEEDEKKPGHEKSFRIVISSNFFDKLKLKKKIKTKYSFNTRVKGIPKKLIDYYIPGQKRVPLERLKKWMHVSDLPKVVKACAIRHGFLTKKGEITERTKRIQFLYKLIENWDIKEVKLIKKIKLRSPQYVYDLVVSGNHSFVGGAGSLLLHNTGGEPTINNDLPKFIKKIKKLGYAVKLDTNGSDPILLKKLIDEKLVDYVAMDIKGPKERYSEFAGVKVNIKKIQKSIDILKEGKVDCEFRSTIVPTLHKKEDVIEMAKWIRGAKKYYLQNFRPEKTIDPKFEKIKSYPEKYLLEIQKAISPFFEVCQVR